MNDPFASLPQGNNSNSSSNSFDPFGGGSSTGGGSNAFSAFNSSIPMQQPNSNPFLQNVSKHASFFCLILMVERTTYDGKQFHDLICEASCGLADLSLFSLNSISPKLQELKLGFSFARNVHKRVRTILIILHTVLSDTISGTIKCV